jgi:hypothetical protein
MLTLVLMSVLSQVAPDSSAATPAGPPSAVASPAAQADAVLEDDARSLLAPPPTSKAVQGVIAGGGGYQFRTNFDDGGDLAITRFVAGAQFRLVFTEQVSLGLNLGYRFDRYEFGGNVFPALGSNVDPWRDIHTLGLGAIVNWAIDDRWSVSGGPIAQFAGESDVDVDDAASIGGIVATSYKVSDTLLLGGGIAVLSQIEDDVLVFPTILLDWKINDALRLTTRGGPTAVVRQGLELVYAPHKELEFAFGGRYETERFRLSSDNAFSDGVGEQSAVPIWLRASWLPMPTLRFDLFMGVTPWSQITLEDRDGNELAQDDVDWAPFVGGYVSWAF